MTKLNLGGGLQKIPGFTNLDRKTGQEAYPLASYSDGSVDEIRASHLLEHFSHREAPQVLAEWIRALKPGGYLKIAVPDFDWIRQHADDPKFPIEGYLMGGQVDESDYHKSLWTERKLRSLMQSLGLVEIARWQSEISDCASLPVSLNLMGRKAEVAESVRRIEVAAKVAAICSVPRLGWQDHFGASWRGLNCSEFRIPLWKFGGAFWEQGMSKGLQALIDDGVEWAIALDYDTLFDHEDVKELLTLAAEYPEADAIVPIQVRRNNDQFLFTMRDPFGNLRREASIEEFEADLTEIDTGHFGLTLIKLAALKDIPKPWLWSQPGPEGDWGKDKIDADIYFWNKFKMAGRRIFQANHIKIGHLQVTAAWCTNDFQIIHQYISDWQDNGKPKECRREN